MKKNFTHFLFLVLTLVIISSCSSDDDGGQDINNNIIGTSWKAFEQAGIFEITHTVVFSSNNEASWKQDILIYPESSSSVTNNYLYEYSEGEGVLINIESTGNTTSFKVLDNKLLMK